MNRACATRATTSSRTSRACRSCWSATPKAACAPTTTSAATARAARALRRQRRARAALQVSRLDLRPRWRAARRTRDGQDGRLSFRPSIRLPELRVGTWHGLCFVGAGAAPAFEDFVRSMETAAAHELSPQHYHFHARAATTSLATGRSTATTTSRVTTSRTSTPGLNRLLDYRSTSPRPRVVLVATQPARERRRPVWRRRRALLLRLPEHDAEPAAWAPAVEPRRAARSGPVPGRVRLLLCRRGKARQRRRGSRRIATSRTRCSSKTSRSASTCSAASLRVPTLAGRLHPSRENALHHFHELLRRAYLAAVVSE
jgi:choline monooxygenase